MAGARGVSTFPPCSQSVVVPPQSMGLSSRWPDAPVSYTPPQNRLACGPFLRLRSVNMRSRVLLIPVCFLAACNTPEPKSPYARKSVEDAPPPRSQPVNLAEFEQAAAHFKSIVRLPELETTSESIQRAVSN